MTTITGARKLALRNSGRSLSSPSYEADLQTCHIREANVLEQELGIGWQISHDPTSSTTRKKTPAATGPRETWLLSLARSRSILQSNAD